MGTPTVEVRGWLVTLQRQVLKSSVRTMVIVTVPTDLGYRD